MQTLEPARTDSRRITVIDAMRGIALIGICLTHAMQYFGAFPPSLIEPPAPWVVEADGAVNWFVRYFIAGKFYMIFSFLFGLSFFIQMDRASRKGVDFRPRFLWRLTLLLIIGYVHSLIFHMDILIIYAAVGFPLVLMYKVPGKVLAGIALFLLLGGVSLGVIAYEQLKKPAVEQAEQGPRRRPNFSAERPDVSFAATLKNNAADRLVMKANFQHRSGRVYMTLGLFVLGLLAGRVRLFHELDKYRAVMYRLAGVSVVLLALLYVLQGHLPRSWDNPWLNWLSMPVGNLINLLTAYLWVTAIVYLYRKASVEKALAPVVSYGRMGLTNYILQSILGVFLFYRFGLGLNQYVGPFLGMMVCLGYSCVQIYFSHWWLRRFRYGPLEWLWRSGTYTSWQPLRKAVA